MFLTLQAFKVEEGSKSSPTYPNTHGVNKVKQVTVVLSLSFETRNVTCQKAQVLGTFSVSGKRF